MLGIPGDNTYSNMSEARLSLWEDTIVPILQLFCDSLSVWISAIMKENITIEPDLDTVSVLAERRATLWNTLNNARLPLHQRKMGNGRL